ncbi:hypothetical protein Hypma_005734 [Hypsizygus marmoreus]|uniref:Uncharacterized protein n=1 Tax=Hypsizygus marmoreus TaxID=39966 RepID=A0A369KGA9_HYPMA|nr:hypothetical protein Hypma_005734 [Hypsizygus marmoreus]
MLGLVTATAWRSPYQGDAAKSFIDSIHGMNSQRLNRAYDNIIPIVQSSGTGKSRMVDEAAKSVFTLPCNLRPREDTTGYPKADPTFRGFLLNTFGLTHHGLKIRYLFFFSRLFTMVAEDIEKMSAHDTYAAFANAWYEKLLDGEYRNNLYQGATEGYGQENRVIHEIDYHEKASDSRNLALKDAEKKCISALERLLRNIERQSGDGNVKVSHSRPVRLLLYFDEAHYLLSPTTAARLGFEQLTAFDVLCDTFGTFSQHDVFVAYLSTSPTIISPPGRSDSWSPVILQAPYVELPFDVYPQTVVVENMMSIEEVAQVSHLVKFGRPLFWTRWGIYSSVDMDTIPLARMKILCSMDIKEGGRGEIAATCIRLLIEFSLQRGEANELACRLVEAHMRIVFSVPQHRQYLYTGTPSEPLLAEASAGILHKRDTGFVYEMTPAVRVVSGLFSRGMIPYDDRAALAARLLLTLARDESSRLGWRRFEAVYSAPVSVLSFLEALVGPTHMDTIRKARPGNIPNGITLEEAFKDAEMNFTHFAKGGDDSILSDRMAWMALARCMAWQCGNNGQQAIHLYIPILLWNVPLGRYVVSGIFVQIRRHAEHPIPMDVEGLGFFSPGGGKNATSEQVNAAETRPYITLTMDFGDIPDQLFPNETHTSCEDSHPCYAISIVGCSPAVYSVIKNQAEHDVYTRLVSSRDVLDEHPRVDEEHRKAVMHMKPSWSMTDGSFDWAIRDASHKSEPGNAPLQDPPSTVEGVYIQEYVPPVDSEEDSLK